MTQRFPNWSRTAADPAGAAALQKPFLKTRLNQPGRPAPAELSCPSTAQRMGPDKDLNYLIVQPQSLGGFFEPVQD
jgi:hypothetical protein